MVVCAAPVAAELRAAGGQLEAALGGAEDNVRVAASAAAAVGGGYAQSKRVGELLVDAATRAGRISAGSTVLRVGLVGPSMASAHANAADALMRTLRVGAALGIQSTPAPRRLPLH